MPATGARPPRAVRNVLANWTGYVVGLLVNFVLSPRIVHHLGAADYGVWTLLVTVTAYLGLLDLGIRSAVTRYVARSESRGEQAASVEIASAALGVLGPLAVVALVASVGIGWLAPALFHIPAGARTTTSEVAALIGAATAVTLVSGALGGVIVGRQRFDLLCVVDVTSTLVRAALVLTVIAADGGLVALAGAQLLVAITTAVLTAGLARRVHAGLRLRPTWSRPHMRLIVTYGGFAFVAQLASSIIERSGVLVLGALGPVTAVTVFAIAGGLVDYVRALAGGIRTTLAPRASALEGRGQAEALRALTLQGARYTTLLVLPIAATFVVRGATFIGLWMGPAYGAPSGAVLAVLAVRLVFLTATGAAANVMLGASRERSVAVVFVGEALLNVAATLALVPRLGVLGAAWGVAVPTIAAAVIVWPWLLRRRFGVAVSHYVLAAWGRPLLAVLPFTAATVLVERFWVPSSLAVFVVQTALLVPLAVIGAWGVGLTREERQRGLQSLRAIEPLSARRRGPPAARPAR
ncbi:MAG TPA: oligosaccharide flippase family protein [Methylomirabilota bacterium]|jgi:O-antigen/teichoic acid export membrane protein|nr:oligosaccharide flippase family protein [Methylomirabilota bacterium]